LQCIDGFLSASVAPQLLLSWEGSKGVTEENMKMNGRALGAALVFTVAGMLPAMAAQTGDVVRETVFEQPVGHVNLAAHFAVDRKDGRAWIDVVLTDSDYPDRVPVVVRKKVDGLSYDQNSKQVIYRSGSKKIVCAEDYTVLGDTSLKESGACRLLVSDQNRKVDDGFRIKKKDVGTVVFEAANP
jgi:hypothetical protein